MWRAGLERLAGALLPNASLTKLVLGDNYVGPGAAEALGGAVGGGARGLACLSLNHVHADGDSDETHALLAPALGDALARSASLRSVCAADNVVADTAALAAGLTASGSLTHLEVTASRAPASLRALFAAAGAHPALRSLDVSTDWIHFPEGHPFRGDPLRDGDDPSVLPWPEALRVTLLASSSLSSLRLHCMMDDPGDAAAVARGCLPRGGASRGLTSLDLTGCALAGGGACEALRAAMEAPGCVLSCLRFGGRSQLGQPPLAPLSSSDVSHLAEGVAASGSLTELDLSDLGVCEQGARILADALPRAASLTTLDLTRNAAIGDGCADALAGGLLQLPRLCGFRALRLFLNLPQWTPPELRASRGYTSCGISERGEEVLRAAAKPRRVCLGRR